MDQIRDIKEITLLKGSPPIIYRLSRSLMVFFFAMLMTAVILLVINIKDKLSFQDGILAVEDVFKI